MSNPTIHEKLYLTALPDEEPVESSKDPVDALTEKFKNVRIGSTNIISHPHNWRIMNSPTLGSLCLSLFNRLDTAAYPLLAPIEEKIKRVKNKETQEQLVHLLLLLKTMESPYSLQTRLTVIEWALSLQLPTPPREIHEILGILLVTTRYNLPFTIQQVSLHSNKAVISSLYDLVEKLFNQIAGRALTAFFLHQEFQTAKPENSLSIELGSEIAQFVIDKTGHLNHGVFNYLKHLLENHNQLKAARIHLVTHIFDWCRYFPSFRELLLQIGAPDDQPTLQYIVRTTLSLNENTPILPYQASQAALSMLFSTLRQGQQKNCFATSIAMGVRSGNPFICLKDIKELFKHGSISRSQTRFAFLLRSEDSFTEYKLQLNPSLQIVRNGQVVGELIDYPPLKKVLNFFRSKDPYVLLQRTMASFDLKFPVSLRIILQRLAKQVKTIAAYQELSEDSIYQRILLAFGSTTYHPLGSVWKNTIAGAFNWDRTFLSLARVAVSTAFSSLLRKKNPVKAHCRDHILEKCHELFNLNTTYYYDPSLQNNQSFGGFTMYARYQEGEKIWWKRISKEEEFIRYIKDTVVAAGEMAKRENSLLFSEKVFQQMLALCGSREFLTTVVELFNVHFSSNEAKKHLPWALQSGLDTQGVLETYLEAAGRIKHVSIESQNPTNLLVNLVNFASGLSAKELRVYTHNPRVTILCRIPGYHAFSLSMGNSRLLYLARQKSIQQWLKNTYIPEGRVISASPLDEQTQIHIILDLGRMLGVSPVELEPYVTRESSVRDFGNRIIQRLYQITRRNNTAAVSNAIVAMLPPELEKKFNGLVIPFVDTNWDTGHREIHWCFLFNPVTGNVEVWETDDHQSQYSSFDTQKLFEKPWEIFRTQQG